jgi:hypothetical protein
MPEKPARRRPGTLVARSSVPLPQRQGTQSPSPGSLRPHETQSPEPGHSQRRRGAPPGNINALKHGFYTCRLKRVHLAGVESTDSIGLAEEIALIRVFTRRLIESIDLDGNPNDLAEVLRILCLASSTISRGVRTQFLLTSTGSALDGEISEAIRRVNEEFIDRRAAASNDPSLLPPSLHPSLPIPSHEKVHLEKD